MTPLNLNDKELIPTLAAVLAQVRPATVPIDSGFDYGLSHC